MDIELTQKKTTEFRIWTTKIIKEYMTKGFVLNDERFIRGNKYDAKYFDELIERIKAIRVSERMSYQQITIQSQKMHIHSLKLCKTNSTMLFQDTLQQN